MSEPTPLDTDVAVVGAGITGLTAAHFLRRRALRVRVVEAADRPGGAIRTTCHGPFQVEHGPNSLLDTSPVLHELCGALGIADELVYASDAARNRYIVRRGQLHALPMSPPAFVTTRLFSARAKFRLMLEPLVGRAPAEAEETLAQFVERRLGREFLDYAIDAFVAGVYAGVPARLSVRDAFPRLYRLETRYGSILKGAVLGRRERRRSGRTAKQSARMFSFRQGMQTLVEALARPLGRDLLLRHSLTTLARGERRFVLDLHAGGQTRRMTAKAVLLTVPVRAYDQIQVHLDFEPVRSALRGIYYPPVAMAFFGYRGQPGGRPLDGFGFLTPTCERRQILGTLFSSTLFPGRAPQEGAGLTTFLGGARQPDHARVDDERLVELVHADLRDLLGIQASPDEVVIQRWEEAIPQYEPGHRQRMATLLAFEASHPGVFVGGSFRGGISVADCIESAQSLAERVAAAVDETDEEVRSSA